MNWFERHLNWTALAMAVVSIPLTVFLFVLSNGWNLLDLRGLGFRPTISVLVTLVIITCYAFSAIGYGWILHRKNRSLFFLLYFLPGVLMCLYFLFKFTTYSTFAFSDTTIPFATISIVREIPQILIATSERINPLPEVVFLNIIFLVIAWIILILMDDKSYKIEVNNTSLPKGERKQNPFSLFILSGKRVGYSLLSVLLISCIFAIGSFCNLNYGSSLFKYHWVNPDNEYKGNPFIPVFSFDYPSRFSKPRPQWSYYEMNDNESEIVSQDLYCFTQLYGGEEASILITIFSKPYTRWLQNKVGTTEDGFINYVSENYTSTLEHIFYSYFSHNSTVSKVMTGNIASRQTVSNDNYHSRWSYSGTLVVVDFLYDGQLWVIKWQDWHGFSNPPPAYFTHLLETFKIYDE